MAEFKERRLKLFECRHAVSFAQKFQNFQSGEKLLVAENLGISHGSREAPPKG
jgi:hypothetical protein